MNDLARVGCIGDLLVEFVCATRNGRHKRAATYSGPYPSGAAGIFIDQAAQVGGRCIFVGGVGDDAFGEVVLRRLVGHKVAPQLIRVVPGVPTGTAFVSYNDDGSRDFVYNIVLSAAAASTRDDATIAALDDLASTPCTFRLGVGDEGMSAKVLRVFKALHAEGARPFRSTPTCARSWSATRPISPRSTRWSTWPGSSCRARTTPRRCFPDAISTASPRRCSQKAPAAWSSRRATRAARG